ncbi:homoserine kinase [Aquibacillus sp. 3ASR75-11]|uniref:Homoserine kinase n=1 Tax=Terrihalobacillus insolitus TaxID=2950438 RepID=A0A9X3WSD4_9BACI|nr:homoserine kinase [Terrihalobacillus insolitus]MDC3412366.1 homoserine kinase [Terrihalobacillus insolitus]MDC3422941.1 homoserine kinase [Terrihalobacillus insolitus]
MSYHIRVPASTSNLGPGFDSVGLALNLYLDLYVLNSDKWEFIPLSSNLNGIPVGKDNLIYQIGSKVATRFGKKDLPPCRVEMTSNIPLARGLGSSATATIAGIELANRTLDLNLSIEDKVELATWIEGHPDNVVPSLIGGCIIGHYDGQVDWIKVSVDKAEFVAIIPEYELKTSEARDVLPKELAYKKSVQASSIANVSVAAICMQDWALVGKMMKKDLFHQPYRKQFIPHYDDIESYLEHSSYGVFLSGAGPTIMVVADPKSVKENIEGWKKDYPEFKWFPLSVSNNGLEVTELYVEKSK